MNSSCQLQMAVLLHGCNQGRNESLQPFTADPISGLPEQNQHFSHGLVVYAFVRARLLLSFLFRTRPKKPDRMLPVIAGQFYELIENVSLCRKRCFLIALPHCFDQLFACRQAQLSPHPLPRGLRVTFS